MKTIDIVFDGPPGPISGRFVEVENEQGTSIKFGQWVERDDGYWVLRIPDSADLLKENERLQSVINKAYQRLGFTGHKNETMKILGTALKE